MKKETLKKAVALDHRIRLINDYKENLQDSVIKIGGIRSDVYLDFHEIIQKCLFETMESIEKSLHEQLEKL